MTKYREFELGPGDTVILPGANGILIRVDVRRSTTPNGAATIVTVPEDVDVEMFSRRD
jgi:hypothetical protein